MRDRMHAARVVARTQVVESMLSPGLYVALSAGFIIGWLLCTLLGYKLDRLVRLGYHKRTARSA